MKTKVQGMGALVQEYKLKLMLDEGDDELTKKWLEEFGYKAIRQYLLQVMGPILFKLEPTDEEYDNQAGDH